MHGEAKVHLESSDSRHTTGSLSFLEAVLSRSLLRPICAVCLEAGLRYPAKTLGILWKVGFGSNMVIDGKRWNVRHRVPRPCDSPQIHFPAEHHILTRHRGACKGRWGMGGHWPIRISQKKARCRYKSTPADFLQRLTVAVPGCLSIPTLMPRHKCIVKSFVANPGRLEIVGQTHAVASKLPQSCH